MEVTKVLLEHGSQVDPVHMAAARGDAETCLLLVSSLFQLRKHWISGFTSIINNSIAGFSVETPFV